MILRENYFTVQEYLRHLRDEKQLDADTVRISGNACRYLIQYADTRPLYDLANKRPTFPEYISTSKGKLTSRPMTATYQAKMLENIRHFYTWARMYKRGLWAKVSEGWIDNLRVRRSLLNSEKDQKGHIFWEMDTLEKVASFKPQTLKDERTQAAIIFMFMSGMRITAFCSLPVDCVDIGAGRIEQKPSRGVITKNRKSAVTFLLPIPEFKSVIQAWDERVRSAGARLWFAPISRANTTMLEAREIKSLNGRRGLLDGDLREFCVRLGIPILSAHKLRHAHGVYGVRNARNIEELKAVSQNMMHANIGITDGIYGILPEENVQRVIGGLSKEQPAQAEKQIPPEVLELAKVIIAKAKEKK